MNTYRVNRSDIFFLAKATEVIVHLPDFALADSKPKAVLVSLGGVDVSMQVRGMGNQQGKLAIHLVPEDHESFVRLFDSMSDEEMTLSA